MPFWDGKTAPESPTEVGQSLYERRLTAIVEQQRAFENWLAAQPDEVDDIEVRQRLRPISADYEALLADNPDALEPRLLYGKLLRRYGDREGAMVVFIEADRIAPETPVVKQQIGNWYAEEGKAVAAVSYFMQAVALQPDEAVYHFSLAKALHHFTEELIDAGVYERKALEAALLDHFRRAAELAPDQQSFQFRYGEAFYDVSQPDWSAAAAHWEALLARLQPGPYQDAVRLHLARVLLELGDFKEAAAYLHAPVAIGLETTRQDLLQKLTSR